MSDPTDWPRPATLPAHTPLPSTEAVRRLRRTLWGIPPSDAMRLISEQEQAFATQLADLRNQVEAERTELHRVRQAIERHRRQVQSAREMLASLGHDRARQEAQRAITARFITEELDRLEAAHATRLQDLQFEEVRAGSDLQRQRSDLYSLIADLHERIEGYPAATITVPPQGGTTEAPPPEPEPDRSELPAFLIGKVAGQTLATAASRVIVRAGETISVQTIAAAEAEGLLTELLLAVRLS